MNKTLISLAVLSVFFFSGCATQMSTIGTGRATPGFGNYTTTTRKDLASLPKPKKRIPVAVYKFRDQTGQYKYPLNNATNFSTAVTQGPTSLLIDALEASGWFILLEREALSNLLTERKIIRQTSEAYAQAAKEKGETADPVILPPLMYAPILLEGGIIGYDSNLVTSAAGAKYIGVGGSVQYRQDQLSIFLRAISTKNGEILKTVNTSKTILSRQLDLGMFQFVSVKDLLEAEVGFSTNEPVVMCTSEAIEKAVTVLIIEGLLMNFWELKNPEDMKSPVIQKYLKGKEDIEVKMRMDEKGNIKAERVAKATR